MPRMADKKPVRDYRHWEDEMLGEYLGKYHPECRVVMRVRLGPLTAPTSDPTLTPEEQRFVGTPFRRWADAMCVEGRQLNVIEAALIPQPGDISLLETYLHMVDVTPELQDVKHFARQGILVWAVDDPYSRMIAVRHGLQVVIYKPSNFGEWIAAVRARERRTPRTGLLVPSDAG